MAATSVRLSNESMPNVWAFSFLSESGTKITLYKSTPGDTGPRMSMGPVAVAVVNPERFGAYTTLKEFRAWCEAFVAAGQEES